MVIRTVLAADKRALARLLRPAERRDDRLRRRVRGIVEAVRKGGDRALLRYDQGFSPAQAQAAMADALVAILGSSCASVDDAVRC